MHLVRNHFSQLMYTKILHSCPNNNFCIFLRAKGFLNVVKDNQTSFSVQWSRMDAFAAKLFFATSLHQNIALKCETRVLHLFTCQSFLNAPRDNQSSLWVHWSRMHAFAAKPFSQHRYTEIVH
jgi:hypothetical protein